MVKRKSGVQLNDCTHIYTCGTTIQMKTETSQHPDWFSFQAQVFGFIISTIFHFIINFCFDLYKFLPLLYYGLFCFPFLTSGAEC